MKKAVFHNDLCDVCRLFPLRDFSETSHREREHPENNNLPGEIPHLYYQIRKFMKKPSLLNEYKSYFQNPIKKYLPIRHLDVHSVGRDRDGNYEIYKGTVNYSTTDYKSFVTYDCKGLTKNRTKTFSTIRGKLCVHWKLWKHPPPPLWGSQI